MLFSFLSHEPSPSAISRAVREIDSSSHTTIVFTTIGPLVIIPIFFPGLKITLVFPVIILCLWSGPCLYPIKMDTSASGLWGCSITYYASSSYHIGRLYLGFEDIQMLYSYKLLYKTTVIFICSGSNLPSIGLLPISQHQVNQSFSSKEAFTISLIKLVVSISLSTVILNGSTGSSHSSLMAGTSG